MNEVRVAKLDRNGIETLKNAISSVDGAKLSQVQVAVLETISKGKLMGHQFSAGPAP